MKASYSKLQGQGQSLLYSDIEKKYLLILRETAFVFLSRKYKDWVLFSKCPFTGIYNVLDLVDFQSYFNFHLKSFAFWAVNFFSVCARNKNNIYASGVYFIPFWDTGMHVSILETCLEKVSCLE